MNHKGRPGTRRNSNSTCGGRTRQAWDESVGYIREFPKEIYIVFILKFLESYGYFAVSQVLVIYLHKEFGIPDVQGVIYFSTLIYYELPTLSLIHQSLF